MNFLRRNSLEKNKTKQPTDVSKRPDEAVQESGESIILFHWLPVSLGRLAQLELSVLQINQIKKDNSSETSSHTFFFFLKQVLGSHLGILIFRICNQLSLKSKPQNQVLPPKPALDGSGTWCFDFFLCSSHRKRAERDFCASYIVTLQQLCVDVEIKSYGYYFYSLPFHSLLTFRCISQTQSCVVCILHTHMHAYIHTQKTFPQSKEVEMLISLELNWVWLQVLQIKAVATCNHCPI